MEHVETRTVVVGSGKMTTDSGITLEALEAMERELGFAPLDLDAIRGVFRFLIEKLEADKAMLPGILCVSCGTLHLHHPSCRRMAEKALDVRPRANMVAVSNTLRTIDDRPTAAWPSQQSVERIHKEADWRNQQERP